MTIVISDTSPVRALANLGRLELLRELFTEVIVPPAVASELRSPPRGQAAVNLDGLPFVRIQSPSDRSSVERFLKDLDLGESEALALELRADMILIDEAAGRARAKQVRLLSIGVLGVLFGGETERTPRLPRTAARSLTGRVPIFPHAPAPGRGAPPGGRIAVRFASNSAISELMCISKSFCFCKQDEVLYVAIARLRTLRVVV
jgi:predicted nucleic acid-binding protein